MTTEMHTECAEWVLPGHPDKLCDAAVDNIVDFIGSRDPQGQCGLEAACIFDKFFLTGRVAAYQEVLDACNVDELIYDAYRSAGYGVDAAGHVWGPRPEDLQITKALCWGPFSEGERELRHLADDQAICIGYANCMADTDHYPPAHWLARQIARALIDLRQKKGAGQVGPDGKVLARVRTDGLTWEPEFVSISLNHHEVSDWVFMRRFAEEAVEEACLGMHLPELILNGAGMFVAGGPNGDNGTTGKKLAMDAYGPTVPIGGGAWSGKDWNKVDRKGGRLARELALQAVEESGAREVVVRFEYVPGDRLPRNVVLITDGEGRYASLAPVKQGAKKLPNGAPHPARTVGCRTSTILV